MEKFNQASTDYLFTSPDFLTGAATIFNLAGDFYEYNNSDCEQEADCLAISNDFKVVGNDLMNVFSKHHLSVK